MTTFTGIRDVDKIILNQLGPDDLANVCQVQNVYLNRLCDEICQQKVRTEFPSSTTNKPVNMSWSEFYKLLVEADKQYLSILELANKFKNVLTFLVFPGGKRLSRKDIRKFLELWINKYRNIMNEMMINNAEYEIEKAMTYIGGMNHFIKFNYELISEVKSKYYCS